MIKYFVLGFIIRLTDSPTYLLTLYDTKMFAAVLQRYTTLMMKYVKIKIADFLLRSSLAYSSYQIQKPISGNTGTCFWECVSSYELILLQTPM